MKLFIMVLALLSLLAVTALAGGEIPVKSSDDLLRHLQGNNFNIYLVHFYESASRDKGVQAGNEDIQRSLKNVLKANPEFFSAKVDLSNKELSRLGSVVGLNTTPAVLLIVHGKGVWLSGTNANLMIDRLRDFTPKFKQASAHHSNPY
mmetsp:Transcript_21849/g.19388  ORF Transcript_21849/g.19388 Transcript_21849/m.19388 type:complete len:148 (+) Transcript_21849:31-474(+)